MREIVRAETEEFGFFGDLVGTKGSARQLDHRTDHGSELEAGFLRDRVAHGEDFLLDLAQLTHGADERNHDLDLRIQSLGAGLCLGLENRAGLHAEEAGDGKPEPHTAKAEHRVLLV